MVVSFFSPSSLALKNNVESKHRHSSHTCSLLHDVHAVFGIGSVILDRKIPSSRHFLWALGMLSVHAIYMVLLVCVRPFATTTEKTHEFAGAHRYGTPPACLGQVSVTWEPQVRVIEKKTG